MEYILSLRMLLLETISLINIGEALFSRRNGVKDWLCYLVYYFVTFICVNFFFRDIQLSKIRFTVLTIMLLYQAVFIGPVLMKFAAAVSFLVLTYAADYVVAIMVIHVFKIDFSVIYNNPVTYIIVVLTSKTILLLVSFLFKLYARRENNNALGTNIAFVVLPVITLITIISLLYISLNNGIVYWWFILVIRGLILSNVIVMVLFDRLIIENNKLVDTIVFSQRQQVEESTYGAIKEIQERQSSMAHDIKNHLSTVIAMKGGENSIDDKYLGQVVDEVMQSSSVIDCNNITVNAVLNLKYTEAVKNGIDILFDINDLSEIQVMEKDLVTILSNAIDNAIENTLLDENRVIQIKIHDNEYRTVFSFVNPSREIVINDGIIQTTKEDKEVHGYGLKNIKNAVENNNGIMVTKYEEGYFKLTVVFNK